MSDARFMKEIQRSHNLNREILQNTFGQRPNRLDQVLKTSLSSIVLHNRDTTFRAVPEVFVDPNILIGCAQAVPRRDPFFEDLSRLSVCKRHLLHAVDFQRGAV
jgi:hypothetical protein